jgi:hypothetical protein
MKKILVILFLTVPIGLFAQNFPVVTGEITDYRNKIWYQYTEQFETVTIPFFGNYVEKVIGKWPGDLHGTPYESICQRLFDLHNNADEILAYSRVVIVCDDTYGLLAYWWNDNQPFGGNTPQNRLLVFSFFKLK